MLDDSRRSAPLLLDRLDTLADPHTARPGAVPPTLERDVSGLRLLDQPPALIDNHAHPRQPDNLPRGTYGWTGRDLQHQLFSGVAFAGLDCCPPERDCFEERLAAARSTLRFQDRWVADLEARLTDTSRALVPSPPVTNLWP